MNNFYGIPNEPIQYYDKMIKDVHYCGVCEEILPLSRKEIGLCTDCVVVVEDAETKKQKAIKGRRRFVNGIG